MAEHLGTFDFDWVHLTTFDYKLLVLEVLKILNLLSFTMKGIPVDKIFKKIYENHFVDMVG